MNEQKGVIDRIWENNYIIELDDHTLIKVPIGGNPGWKDGDRVLYSQHGECQELKADKTKRKQINLKQYFKK